MSELRTGEPRPARFDRQLTTPSVASWTDADLDRRIARALERGRAQGLAEGYAAGWSQGRQAAAGQEAAQAALRAEQDAVRNREQAAHWEQVLAMLGQAAAELDRSVTPAWEQVGDALADGALALARAALGRELETLDAPVVQAVRTALHTLGDTETTVLRLNPADHELVQEVIVATAATLPAGLQFVPDADVPAGDVLALTAVQRLHLSLPAALAAAQEVLRS